MCYLKLTIGYMCSAIKTPALRGTLFSKEGRIRAVLDLALPSLEKRVPSADGGCFDCAALSFL